MRTLFTVGFLLLVACGDNSAQLEPDAGIDAPPLSDVSCPTGFGLPNIGVIKGGDIVQAASLGDLDADGRADLVYISLSGVYPTVNLRRGIGGRSFGDAEVIESARNARDLAIGDVTGDGNADLVVVSTEGLLSVHAATGSTLAAAVSYTIPQNARRVILANLGGTAALDALVLGDGYSTLVNQGASTFAAATQYEMASRWSDAAVGDFDGDAKLDVALVRDLTDSAGTAIVVAKGNGDGTLAAPVDHDVGFLPSGIAAADFDEDTYADLVLAANGSERSHVLRGSATGFVAGAEHDTGWNRIRILDYDGDDALDLLFGDRLVRGTSSGTFEDAITLTSAFGAEDVLVAQLDGVGDLDFIVRRGGMFEVLLRSAPSPQIAQPGKLGEIYGAAAADFDGNGTLDLATAFHYLNPQFLPGTVAVQLAAGTELGDATGYPTGYANLDVTARDLDGDGDIDLVTTHGAFSASPGTTLLRNDGSGTFTTMYVPFGGRARPVIADLNGDERLDIVVSGGDATTGGARVVVLLGQADGSFVPDAMFPSAAYALAVADIDHANGLDLLVSGQDDRVAVMLSDSDGTFVEASSLAYAGAGALATGDVDGDGDVDVVIRRNNGDAPAVFRNNGDGTFAAAQMIAMDVGAAQGYPGTPRQVLVTDVDGDTNLDLVVPHATLAIVSIALGRGDGTFESQLDFATAGVPTSIATVDHDGDRRREIVVSSGGAVQIFPHVCLP
jgi:hypothetical protein